MPLCRKPDTTNRTLGGGPGHYNPVNPNMSPRVGNAFSSTHLDRSAWTKALSGSTTDLVPHSYDLRRDNWNKHTYNKALQAASPLKPLV